MKMLKNISFQKHYEHDEIGVNDEMMNMKKIMKGNCENDTGNETDEKIMRLMRLMKMKRLKRLMDICT